MFRTLQSGLAAAILVVDPKDEQAARFYYRFGFLTSAPAERASTCLFPKLRRHCRSSRLA
jgi:hypothetical protein